MIPIGLKIDGSTGAMPNATGRYTKRLADLEGIFRNEEARVRSVQENDDPLVYEVFEFLDKDSGVFFGTTVMQPGKVGDEYYMTRGHFHARRDLGEVYYAQSGEGLILLESRDGQSQTIEMQPGICAFIPPDWAHRSINTGNAPFVFFWSCNPEAGHDYGTILERGMRNLVVEQNGMPALIANPKLLSPP